MTSFLNIDRSSMFCPGCAHERVVFALNSALEIINFSRNDIVIVTDIGCSGLFDIFFNTHAMHGLHGRALTYATGLKMVRSDLNVIVIMGDGGLGIGGAHFLASCRRNLNLTLLVLNNFNFGMTGGQFSATTPVDSNVGSGFLNQLENPMDVCDVAKVAGAPYVARCSGYDSTLSKKIVDAILYNGMSVMDIHGICPGRYGKNNRITPSIIEKNLLKLAHEDGEVLKNIRCEYGNNYRNIVENLKDPVKFLDIDIEFELSWKGRYEVIILGSAGQFIITAGEILCLAGLTAGLAVTQKSDYPITVLRGHSISELVLATGGINYTGVHSPNVVIAIAQEGIDRRMDVFDNLSSDSMIITDTNLNIPKNCGVIYNLDFKANKIKSNERGIACLAAMSKISGVVKIEMIKRAINIRFNEKIRKQSIEIVEKINKVWNQS